MFSVWETPYLFFPNTSIPFKYKSLSRGFQSRLLVISLASCSPTFSSRWPWLELPETVNFEACSAGLLKDSSCIVHFPSAEESLTSFDWEKIRLKPRKSFRLIFFHSPNMKIYKLPEISEKEKEEYQNGTLIATWLSVTFMSRPRFLLFLLWSKSSNWFIAGVGNTA